MKTISLKNAKNALNRDELKSFFGGMGAVEEIVSAEGGSCCARPPASLTGRDFLETQCGLTKKNAQNYAAGGGNWCCSSCGTASWV